MQKINCAHDELVELHKLQPNPKNPNKHPEKQIKMLAKIIDYQGQRSPIVVSNRSGFIVKGHGRLDAIKRLGWESAAVDFQDYESEAQEFADMVADNKIAELADHDDNLMIEGMKEFEFDDFELLGLDNFDLPLEVDPAKELIEDEVPSDVETRCKPGDVWLLGKHRLMCGDSTNIQHVERLMDGEKADMVFTDPPYGVEYQSNRSENKNRFAVLDNDDKFLDIAPIVSAFSKGFVFVWTSWKVQNKWINQFKSFDYPSNMIIWHKPGGGIGDLKKTFSSDYEVALVWHRGAELCGKRIGSVWTINKDSPSTYQHPTQKPVALAVEAFDKATNPKEKVLDLFGGSGSTLIACEKTNRKCYMMELDPHYCDVILARWEKYTNKTAALDGQS